MRDIIGIKLAYNKHLKLILLKYHGFVIFQYMTQMNTNLSIDMTFDFEWLLDGKNSTLNGTNIFSTQSMI